jgi:hypothetical protein
MSSQTRPTFVADLWQELESITTAAVFHLWPSITCTMIEARKVFSEDDIDQLLLG